jgi:hypothetical protein
MWKSKFNSLHTVLLKSTGDAAYDFPDQSCTAYCNRAHPNHSQIHPDRMEKARRLRRRVNSQCGRRRKAAERGSDRRANHQSLKIHGAEWRQLPAGDAVRGSQAVVVPSLSSSFSRALSVSLRVLAF